MKNLFLLAFLLLSCSLSAQSAAQQPGARRQGEILAQLAPGLSFEQVFADEPAFTLKKVVADDWRIVLLGFDEQNGNGEEMMARVQKLPGVQVTQWNHLASPRGIPNDPSWSSQVDMELIGMAHAWDGSTGGVMYTRDSVRGDTIVVAVLEEGFLIDHPDIKPNLWHNWGEIPNNNIDDDGNGYVDDYTGWDPQDGGSGGGNLAPHGTSVCGIVGARGNNNTGVSGVSWNVKMMVMTHSAIDESEIIAGYQYVGKQRRRYNETNGAAGAFVVATNASFGIDGGKPAQHPLWCAVYDSLGKVGILNIGATANDPVNVEVVGDIPSTCGSPYLVGVTNVNANSDVLSNSAGYGTTSIDIGAPGDGSFTTAKGPGNTATYAIFTGTSAATPHVTGAVGLLYSLDCPTLASDALSNPTACALRFKELLLKSAQPNNSLQGKTVTGGRLDVGAAVDSVRADCGGSSGPLQITLIRPNPVHNLLEVRYETPNFQPYMFRVFNMLGQLVFEDEITPEQYGEKVYFWEDVYYLPSGIYVATFNQGRARVAKKFVKI